ncbi:hypothetical protein [Pseudorhodoplanes sp.]|uniref:hypothetical protein n=1 Tax=Pseudorhodoplanes sp. TaxID=1934341 RepID=UPI002C120C73|nr:hypothetical protein [Pseudorhodoplanes sp.]HWV54626.1 hypothetical protein [Pseudorhodoplanes sp.]
MTMALKALVAAATVLGLAASIGPVSAAPRGDAVSKSERVKKPVRHQQRVIRHPQAAPAFAHRQLPWADPSFDRNGRPYRPNVYYPCTVDLGYGRFASCDTWND